jgi:Fe2+ or Zn2+ uptake regulation protein
MARLEMKTVEVMVQSYGLKMTPQRRAIVEFLQTAFNHPTADEVFSAVNRQFPMTSRATVYNTLNWLRDAKLIREVHEAGQVRFDPNNTHHHHFICDACGLMEDIECGLIGNLQICVLPMGQTIKSFEVTIRGYCAACRK